MELKYGTVVRTRRRPPSRSRGEGFKAVLFLMPAVLFLAVFVYVPAAMSLALGFYHYHLLGVDTTFAGLSNFSDALHYSVFWISVRNTLVYAAMMIPTTVAGSVLIALLIHRSGKIYALIRTTILLPYITPVIATAIGWMWMFNPQYGVMNAALKFFHLPPSQWLLSPAMALPSVALYSLWHGLGFNVVIVLAALGSIPQQVLESARIDGAGLWTRWWKIIMPLLSPTLFFLFIVTTISTFQAFSQVYALSSGSGGPEYATTTLLLLIYQTAFQYFHFSYAAAMAMMLVLMILALTLLQNWAAKKWVFYQ